MTLNLVYTETQKLSCFIYLFFAFLGVKKYMTKHYLSFFYILFFFFFFSRFAAAMFALILMLYDPVSAKASIGLVFWLQNKP